MKNQEILTKMRILSRTQIVFCGALFGLILSKGLALLPAFALDDYVAVHQDRNPLFYVSQGRFTQAAIQLILSFFGVTPTSISWTATVLFFIFAAIAISNSLTYIARGRGNEFTLAAIGALIGAHPYLTEYFTFRESLITQGTSFGLLALVFISVNRHESQQESVSSFYSLAWLAFPLVLLAGAQQTAFIIAIFVILARLVVDYCWDKIPVENTFAPNGNTPIIFALFVAIIAYVLMYIISRSMLGASFDTRGSILPITDILPRLDQVANMTKKNLIDSEPVLSALPKLLLATMATWFLGRIALNRPKTVAAIILLAGTMYLGSVFLVTISSVWWPVPRAMYGVGFVYGISLTVISMWLSYAAARWLTVGTSVIAIIFSFHSNAMLYDQTRLNRWDAWVAGEIAKDLLRRGVTSTQQVTLVGADWKHPVGMRTSTGDLNISALAVAWSAQFLMMEASGRVWNVGSVDQAEACNEAPAWPAEGAIKTVSGVTYVCMNQR
ncbi:glucosyltransferase domain-containing protein [Cupriavidus taiwanensis]|uniref:glucosyltransferase domain-containing protein n=1 Tax=Cupriavidus taiwanensis TaxID=164546 RepID=UPI0011C04A76|nr:glucosyltransferase domain-containing protein [Cupriavidus taiwanensis]